MRYSRVLIKLSGAAFAGSHEAGFDQKAIEYIVDEILSVAEKGIEVAIVVGGGNIFRGGVAKAWGLERAEGDNIGIIGTIVNSLMLRAALKAKSTNEVRVLSAIPIAAISEPYVRLRAIHHLEKKFIVICAGGIGQPYVTTDYPAVQRAIELRCDAILVAKQGVDGLYTEDPRKNKEAKMYVSIGYNDVIQRHLKIMDSSAIILARDHALPMHLFNFSEKGSIQKICAGNNPGTYIAPEVDLRII
jgi:uridylate kinase